LIKGFTAVANPDKKEKAFTLLELIIVIVIIGVLATLGFQQYALVLEKGRTAEAIARLSVMRKLAYVYYMTNGSLIGITGNDVGEPAYACNSSSYYKYVIARGNLVSDIELAADRCTSGGKPPDILRQYEIILGWNPSSTDWQPYWDCIYTDNGAPAPYRP